MGSRFKSQTKRMFHLLNKLSSFSSSVIYLRGTKERKHHHMVITLFSHHYDYPFRFMTKPNKISPSTREKKKIDSLWWRLECPIWKWRQGRTFHLPFPFCPSSISLIKFKGNSSRTSRSLSFRPKQTFSLSANFAPSQIGGVSALAPSQIAIIALVSLSFSLPLTLLYETTKTDPGLSFI